MINVLITGGAGYIGSHILLDLESNYNVIVFDNLSRGNNKNLRNSKLYKGDLRNYSEIYKCLKKHKIDIVVHLAAYAYVSESVIAPHLYYTNNLIGSINLLEAMRKCKIKKIVFSSSCATYGVVKNEIIDETTTQNPINPYGKSKLFFEKILADYCRAYSISSISLRYFNVAGGDPNLRVGERHEPETHIIPKVLNQIYKIKCNKIKEEKIKIDIYGSDYNTKDGTCVRDYIHVMDLSLAHKLALEKLIDNTIVTCEYYNLSNGDGFSVLEIIKMCEKITGIKIDYEMKDRRVGDPPILIGNSKLFGNKYNWNPEYNKLEDIILHAWLWVLKKNEKN
jgi:UDP-glucose 4-epimerase